MILNLKNKVYEKIIDEQFIIIKEKITYRDIPENGLINIGKKSILWYNHYKFQNKEEYIQWKDWAIKELNKLGRSNEFTILDLTFGLNYHIKKEGSLF